ncbi:hypothetical protein DPMN_071893 [Dreissena polymorpha]|uniref:Uncharacterized protein n=1 Tax=Dreissena polymorpha TaxID=45954 RepID=A0A9D3Z7T4_DREPO|nr:hypothetical protein DPMN_071893 [Dreissena polymorpha]
MANPFPLHLFNGGGDWFLSRPLPEIQAGNSVWPSDLKDVTDAYVDEHLQFVIQRFGVFPGLRPIQQDRLHVRVEEGQLCGNLRCLFLQVFLSMLN